MSGPKCRVSHSHSEPAWNLIGVELGGPHKLARVPYYQTGDENFDQAENDRARDLADFVARCLNRRHEVEAFLLGGVQ